MAGGQAGAAAPGAAEPRSWLGRLLTPVPPSTPRPSEVAYLHACNLVAYEGGDPFRVAPGVRDVIARWEAWQAYDAALAALHFPNPRAGAAAGADASRRTAVEQPDAGAARAADATWRLLIDDLLPYLYAHWDPVSVPQAGRPRRGTPHLANRDGRLSTHLELWAQRHGRDYRWARQLLEQAEAAGLIRRETHRTPYAGGRKVKSWSQWVLLPRDAYERRLAELRVAGTSYRKKPSAGPAGSRPS